MVLLTLGQPAGAMDVAMGRREEEEVVELELTYGADVELRDGVAVGKTVEVVLDVG